jgi:two-component system response regulator AtoC
LAGRFREDLFYRLSTIQIRVPSLSERLDDIPLLIQFFLKKYNEAYSKQIKGLTRRAQTVLYQHAWPGNVRELENVISCACLTSVNEFIDVDDLPENLQKPSAQNGRGADTWRPLPLEEVRRQHIRRVLEACEGNRVRAAQMLGIGRTSLYRRLPETPQVRDCFKKVSNATIDKCHTLFGGKRLSLAGQLHFSMCPE